MKWNEIYRDKKFVGVSELARATKSVLESAEIQQSRNIVSKFPDKRTIRFYLAEGLLPSTIQTEGTSSVFNYTHLLTLVTIKHLQSQGLPIKIIQRIIANKNNSDLEKLLNEPVTVTTDLNQASAARMRGEEVVSINDQDEIREVLENQIVSSTNTTIEIHTWEHYLIAEGIELQISNKVVLNKERKRELVKAIQNFLFFNASH